MYRRWGLPVHKSYPSPAAPGDYSVDSVTLIVRNPDRKVREWEHVDRVCRRGRGCSGSHLLGRNRIMVLVHNPPVLTGTTGILEFFKDRR
jgi:hypothetical protein